MHEQTVWSTELRILVGTAATTAALGRRPLPNLFKETR